MYKGKETKQWDDSVIQKSTSYQSLWCLWLIYETFAKNLPVNSDKITERKKSEGQAEENYKQRNLFLEIF